MNKRITGLLIILFLAAASFIIVYRYVYNKPHPDYLNAKVEASIRADSLFHGFKNSASVFNGRFTGKVIEISGSYSKSENTDSLTIIIFVFSQGNFGDEGIRCTLLQKANEPQKLPEPGTFIKVKGLCTGYNDTDVIFENCTIIH